jgi:hypothetical protein
MVRIPDKSDRRMLRLNAQPSALALALVADETDEPHEGDAGKRHKLELRKEAAVRRGAPAVTSIEPPDIAIALSVNRAYGSSGHQIPPLRSLALVRRRRSDAGSAEVGAGRQVR